MAMKWTLNKILASLLALVLVVGCIAYYNINKSSNKETEEIVEEEEVEEEVESVSITLSFAGDITLGNYVGQGYTGSFNEKYTTVDSSYFLENVKSVFEEDDLTICNLEGPLTTQTSYQDKTYAFSGDPEYAQILVDGDVDVVTLANNHSYDYYEAGFEETKETLDDYEIDYFGYSEYVVEEVKGIKIGFIGLSFPSEYGELTTSLVNTLKEEEGCALIILYVHWGIERDEAPSSSQVALAHEWIDHGIDLVIGSHPHVVQGIEEYNGCNIVYSLGNFCFGGNKNPDDKDSMIYQQTFTFEDGELVSQESNVIACSISSTSSSNNFQPTLLSGDEEERVLEKIESRSELIPTL